MRFLSALNRAIDARDLDFVYSLVDEGFTVDGGPGGIIDGTAMALQSFEGVFGLENLRFNYEGMSYGWDDLRALVNEGSFQYRNDDICGPSNAVAAEDIPESLRDEFLSRWLYVDGSNVRVRKSPSMDGEVITSLSYVALRPVYKGGRGVTVGPWVGVNIPGGGTGFLHIDYLSTFQKRQICFRNYWGTWKISGYLTGGGR